ncbi:hypothetical protein C7974DRAFT_103081 [Boeremia exigua]|uniref:uncharacterized protein n=1 Tax=Boeremia exigua TaxID=749465 RepID=UPI001E8DC4E9|nr:uncharacterized protein C7974DRAFT_103081 [Boeremia exigua]KAH6642483.1 hypothetical protein C7974DRAFT_103081 [Boeremia exigua]
MNSWFEAFATAMTNRFRTEYGSAHWDKKSWEIQTLPLDTTQGIAWRDSVCVAMHWRWLLLPWVLTLVATGLLAWTLLSDWQERHDRPVWKESILPLILYGSRILGKEHESSPPDIHQQNAVDVADESGEKDERLMEIDEMTNVSKEIAVRMQWADNLETEIEESLDGSTSVLEQDRLSLRSRRSHVMQQTTPQPSADLGEYRSVSDMDDASTVGSGNSRVESLTTLQHSPNR